MAHLITKTKRFSYQSLNQELEAKPENKEEISTLLKAYRGDYWQNGKGSLLPPPTGENSSVIQGLMKNRFVYRNVLKEVVERVSKAFFGKYPDWSIDGAGNVEELERVLGEVWTQKNFSAILSKALENRLITGRGGIRVYLPLRHKRRATRTVDAPATEDDVNVEDLPQVVYFENILEAIKAIEIESIEPENGKLLDDDGEFFSIVKYSLREDWDTDLKTNIIEFSFVDDNDLTWIGLAKENTNKTSDALPIYSYIESSGLNLNGKTTYFELKGDPYVTMSMYKNNQLINLALTCSGFSLVDNGFGEMILTNVDLETEKIPDPGSELGYREVPKRLKRGGGVINNLIGISQVNEETGQESVMSPGVHFRQPTDLGAFDKGKSIAYTACLEEAQQLFALISGDATVSGESRIQSMNDFYLKLSQFKADVDQLGSWVLTTILRFASALSDNSLAQATVAYSSKIFIADLSQSEKNLVFQKLQQGLISLDTARVLLGVDDPVQEQEKIALEMRTPFEELNPSQLEQRFNLITSATGILPEQIAYQFLGLSPEQIEQIRQIQVENEAVQFERMREQEALMGGGEPTT